MKRADQLRIAVVGCAGRMGAALAQAVGARDDCTVSWAAEAPGHPRVGRSYLACTISDHLPPARDLADVILEFTSAAAIPAVAAAAARLGLPLVSGTTGFDDAHWAALRSAAATIPILHASNMSWGVTVLGALLRQATRMLPGYDIELIEMHHRRKIDAPSGTAAMLAEAIRKQREGLSLVHGRVGSLGARPERELGIHALRGGDVVGEHEIIFAGAGERLCLRHQADHRGAFASGALAACRFIVDQKPGLYGMDDVLTDGQSGAPV